LRVFFTTGNTIITNTPFGRFGTADELVGPLIMLASGAASFCTGVRAPSHHHHHHRRRRACLPGMN